MECTEDCVVWFVFYLLVFTNNENVPSLIFLKDSFQVLHTESHPSLELEKEES